MSRADGRNLRYGVAQVGEVKPGNLAQFDSDGCVEDAGVSIEGLQAQITELRDMVEKLTKARRKTE